MIYLNQVNLNSNMIILKGLSYYCWCSWDSYLNSNMIILKVKLRAGKTALFLYLNSNMIILKAVFLFIYFKILVTFKFQYDNT